MKTTRLLLFPLFMATLALLPTAGCFDADAISASSPGAIDGLRLEEIDVGEYHVTLPQMAGQIGSGAVEFHIFGSVAHRDRNAAAKALKARGPEIRADVLGAVRSIDTAKLADPKLTAVRTEITRVLNKAIEKPLVQGVGFYSFSYNRK